MSYMQTIRAKKYPYTSKKIYIRYNTKLGSKLYVFDPIDETLVGPHFDTLKITLLVPKSSDIDIEYLLNNECEVRKQNAEFGFTKIVSMEVVELPGNMGHKIMLFFEKEEEDGSEIDK